MNEILLNISLLLSALLLILENIGFLFRLSGLKAGNLLAGYTFQNTWAYSSRFTNLLFAPLFAYLGDIGGIDIKFFNIILYFSFLSFFLFYSIIKQKQIINLLSEIIVFQQKGNSVISAFLRWSVFKNFLKVFIPPKRINLNLLSIKKFRYISNSENSKVRKVLLNYALTHIPFYGCWIFIAILITIYSSRPSFMISLSTYFTVFSSIFFSLYFDPFLSRLHKNKELTIYIYQTLQVYKFFISIITFIIVCIFFKIVK